MASGKAPVGISSILMKDKTAVKKPRPDTQLDEFLSIVFPQAKQRSSLSSGPAVEDSGSDDEQPRPLLVFSNLQQHVESELKKLGAGKDDDAKDDGGDTPVVSQPGRLGPKTVHIDESSMSRNARFSGHNFKPSLYPCTSLESKSNFLSGRANVCVFSGRWMYEATVGTGGIQQIGWATLDCEFSAENGVGDSDNSYAYDGKRIMMWNNGSINYGEAWVPGDIIGCGINLDKGEVSFWRNGRPLGVASSTVTVKPGIAYFPALSLSHAERCRLNFGGTPFAFPIEDYLPIQGPPSTEAQTEYLMSSFGRVVKALCCPKHSGWIPPLWEEKKHKLALACSAHIFHQLTPLLLHPFNVTKHFIPFLHAHGDPVFLEAIMALLVACMEPSNAQTVLQLVFVHLSDQCESLHPWNGGFEALDLARNLLICPGVIPLVSRFHRDIFNKIMAGLFTVKLAGEDDMKEVMPDVWWKSSGTVSCKDKFFEQAHKLEEFVEKVCGIHLDLVTFFNNQDKPVKTSEGNKTPRSLFMNWLNYLVQANLGVQRQVLPPGTNDHMVLCSVWGAIAEFAVDKMPSNPDHHEPSEAGVAVFEDEDTKEQAKKCPIPDTAFYDELVPHFDLLRLGGTPSHVKAEFIQKIESGEVDKPQKKATSNLAFELLDRSMILFSLSMVNPLRRLKSYHNEVREALEREARGNERLQEAMAANPEETEGLKLLKKGCERYKERTVEAVRCIVLSHIAYLRSSRKETLLRWSAGMLKMLRRLQPQPHVSFIPTAYITSIVHIFGVLSNESCPFGPQVTTPFFLETEARRRWLRDYTALISSLIGSGLVVCPDLNINLVVALKNVLEEPLHVAYLETCPELNTRMLRCLLNTFGSRYWVPATDPLVRFWSGAGFASNACLLASEADSNGEPVGKCDALRKEFQHLCETDISASNEFLNHLINHVNWIVTEFDHTLEDIRTFDESSGDMEKMKLHRKCSVTFELSVSLLRLVEAAVLDGGPLFCGTPTSWTNVVRVVKLVGHVLNRMCTSPLFDAVTSQKHPSLQSLNKMVILSPIFGTLMGLVREDLCPVSVTYQDVCAQSRGQGALAAIMNDGGLDDPSITYLQEYASHLKDTPGFTEAEGTKLRNFAKLLKKSKELLDEHAERRASTEEDDLCTICYTYNLNATLEPCGHRACQLCIDIHRKNEDTCFFCKAKIEDVTLDEIEF